MKKASFGRAVTAFGVSAALAAGSLLAATAPANALTAKPVYLSFEDNDGNAAAAASGTFGGASGAIAAVPTADGHSGKGLEFTKAGEPWSGVNILLNKSYRITDADNKVITFDYFNPDNVASPVMAKVDGAGSGLKAVMANPGWNSLSFDMSTGAGWDSTKEYPTLAVFPNFGADNGLATTVPNTGQKYYIDNVSVNGGTIANVEALVVAKPVFLSFEDNDANAAAAAGGTFGGASGAIAAVPTADGHSGKGLEFTKSGEAWSGVNVLLNKSYRITDANHKVITFDYFNPDNVASPVMAKVDGAGNALKAVMANPGWNSLSFDMSTGAGWDSSKPYPTLAIFPNFGADNGLATTVPNTGQKYYIDNLSINGGTISDVETNGPAPRVAASLLLTFEDDDTVGAKATGEASDADGAGSFEGAPPNAIVAAAPGGNGGKVLEFTKSGQLWSGFIAVSDIEGTNKFGSTQFPVITVNFYNSAATSVPVMIKLEAGASNARKYVVAAPGWSTLSFDMSSGANGWDGTKEYTKVVLFPNWADPDLNAPAAITNADYKFHFDDIAMNGATTPALPPAPVVKVSQTVGKTIALMKPAKLAALPGKTSKGLTIKWVSRTKLICVISGTSAAPKVKTLKVGTCKLTGTNAGNSTTKSVTTYRAVVVKK